VGVVGLTLFVVVEGRVAAPQLPLDLLSNRQFSGANAVTFAVYGGLGGALFLLPIQLEQGLHYSPMAAGLSLMPVTVIMLLLSARSGALAARIGPRLQMTVGPLLVAAGLALISRIHPGVSYARGVLPAVVVLGFGLATTVAPLTASVLAAAPSHRSGVASAVNNDVARVAGLVAVAVLPSAAGITGAVYLEPLRLTNAFHDALVVAAAAGVIGSMIALATIRNPAREGPPEEPCLQCGLDAPALTGRTRNP
jgi:MFS family permease